MPHDSASHDAVKDGAAVNGFTIPKSHTITDIGVVIRKDSLCTEEDVEWGFAPSPHQRGEKPTTMLRNYLRYLQQGRCIQCSLEEWRHCAPLDIHRTIPGKHGGLYTMENTVLLCRKCHGTGS